jgi:hypothetical protein
MSPNDFGFFLLAQRLQPFSRITIARSRCKRATGDVLFSNEISNGMRSLSVWIDPGRNIVKKVVSFFAAPFLPLHPSAYCVPLRMYDIIFVKYCIFVTYSGKPPRPLLGERRYMLDGCHKRMYGDF